jgi:hypothetical protein
MFDHEAHPSCKPSTQRNQWQSDTRARDQAIKLFLSLINVGEGYYTTQRERGRDKAIETLVLLDQLPIRQEPVDRTLVLSAALIKANTAISYADAFAAQIPTFGAQPICLK